MFATTASPTAFLEPSFVAITCSQEAYLTYGWSDFPVVGESFLDLPSEEDSVSSFPIIEEKKAEAYREKPTHARKVSFNNAMQVRTQEVELGDHPCCLGGMALQCGWSYDESIVDLDTHEEYSLKRRGNALRLSFRARRKRLQEVTGLNGSDLLRLEYQMLCEEEAEKEKVQQPAVLRHSNTLKIFQLTR